jgi:hypothetical protein
MDCKYDALKHAGSIADVIQATASFLASWSRDELERLPDSCRPGWVRDGNDIEYWADRLLVESARAQLFMDDERKLDGMMNHFLIASVRLRQLAAG